MTQHFQNTPQVKTRKSVLVLMKHSAPPLVLYSDTPEELYEDFITPETSNQLRNAVSSYDVSRIMLKLER